MSRTDVVRRRVVGVTVALALFAASCGGDDGGDGANDVAAEGEDSAGSSRFIGLVVDDAVALAESEGRLWRVSRDGTKVFDMDAALVEGRVTFEVDDGAITSASIESESGSSDSEPDEGVTGDPLLAQLQADAIIRLVTVDHHFASDTLPFDMVIVSTQVASTSQPLQPFALELIAEGLQGDAAVKFTQRSDAEIGDLTDREAAAAAVVEIEDVRVGEDRAEIDLSLWCGNACAVFLTYEAELDMGRWNITGTAGPVAV